MKGCLFLKNIWWRCYKEEKNSPLLCCYTCIEVARNIIHVFVSGNKMADWMLDSGNLEKCLGHCVGTLEKNSKLSR